MKKLLAFFIVLSFLVPSVFADLTVKGNAYGQLNVLQVYDDQSEADDDDVFAKLGRGDDNGDGVRARIDLTGSAGEGLAGYRLMLNYRPLQGNFTIDDWAYGWVKPLGNDFLQVNFGKFNVDTLRGKQGDTVGGKFGTYMGKTLAGENDIFHRFQGNTNGLVLISSPVAGATVGFGVKQFQALDALSARPADTSKAGAQWEKFHLAAGYDIPNIGLARVGLLAAGRDDHQNSYSTGTAKGIPVDTRGGETVAEKSGWVVFPTGHLIQAAFQLKALESTGLALDFGFGLPIAYKVAFDNPLVTAYQAGTDDTEYQAPLNLSLGTNFKFGDFGIGLRTDLFFAGTYKIGDADKQNLPLTFDLLLAPSYTIQNIGQVGVQLGFRAYGAVKDEGIDETLNGGVQTMAFGGWYEKAVAGGILRVGLAYNVSLEPVESFVRQKDIADKGDKKSPGIFTIPVLFELAF